MGPQVQERPCPTWLYAVANSFSPNLSIVFIHPSWSGPACLRRLLKRPPQKNTSATLTGNLALAVKRGRTQCGGFRELLSGMLSRLPVPAYTYNVCFSHSLTIFHAIPSLFVCIVRLVSLSFLVIALHLLNKVRNQLNKHLPVEM